MSAVATAPGNQPTEVDAVTTRQPVSLDPTPAPLSESLWQKDESVPLVDHTVGSLLAERARQRPDSLALVGAAHGTGAQPRLTHRELYAEAAAGGLALA